MKTRIFARVLIGAFCLFGSFLKSQAAEPLAASQPADHSIAEAGSDNLRVYIGTYTGADSKGIYLFEMDPVSGRLTARGVAAEVVNPSFLALHPSRKYLYAVGEIGDFAGKKAGAVSAFAISADSGKLTLLNQQPSGGSGPCHVTVHKDGRYVGVANYGSGSVAVLPIGPDGRLAEPRSTVQHEGSGPVPKRQQGPHAHSVNFDPAGRYAFAADLGVDKIFVYRFSAETGELKPNEPGTAVLRPGSGPRHFAFHPSGPFAYVINEIASSVTAFSYDAKRGMLKELQTISTLPPEFTGASFTAEVQVHPSGKFLYGSNRGHDSIAIFSIDPSSGRLTAAGHQSTQGRTPRNFGIDPSGSWLIAANQASNSLVVFRIDSGSGRLEPTGISATVTSPVCVRFVPRKELSRR